MSELISLDLIDPNPFQPRLAEDAETIGKLADNIERNGLLQIPSARQVDGRYQLAFGHTRKAAYDLLNKRGDLNRWDEMPLNIVDLNDLQMFEAAVSENIQRRDLNPMEVAQAMKRYMSDFGKNSDECGAFFGMNGATARGKVRLIDLPLSAQKALIDGHISEGTARTLLSVAKLADEKALNDLVKRIIEDGKHGETPEEVVDFFVDRLPNVREMWASHMKEKPRGGRGLWLLDMKNFPNKLLPELSAVDIAMIFGIQDDRRALNCIDQAADVNALIAMWRTSDFEADHPRAERLEHLVHPPACTACPFYTVINKDHYCGVKICHERKEQAFIRQKMEDMSRSLKIALYNKEADGAYLALESDVATHKKAFESRHADLRLIPSKEYSGYVWQRFQGVDSGLAKLVAVGALIDKVATKKSKTVGKKSEKEKAEMRAMRQYRVYRKELMWDYAVEAATVFANLPMSVLERICGWHYIGVDDRIPDDRDDENKRNKDETFQARALVWRIIMEHGSHYARSDMADLLELFVDAMGVKASKELTARVKKWDAEIDALAKPVAVETKGKK